jgi:hypothetical protein
MSKLARVTSEQIQHELSETAATLPIVSLLGKLFTNKKMFDSVLVVSDRNRGEFRFIKGQAFSTRYRNKLQLERDIKYGAYVFTPYAYDEVFYDTRYGQWTPNRYAFGVQLPIGAHVVLQPYYLRQDGNRRRQRLARDVFRRARPS